MQAVAILPAVHLPMLLKLALLSGADTAEQYGTSRDWPVS